MNIRDIRVQHGHSTKTGKIIRDLCNQVEKLHREKTQLQYRLNIMLACHQAKTGVTKRRAA